MSKLFLIDYAAISPLLILLFGALCLIFIESFSTTVARRFSALLTAITLLAASGAEIYAPTSQNPLLTRWIVFDSIAHFFILFFIFTTLAVTLLSESFFQRFKVSQGEYFFLLLSSTLGLILISIANDFLTLFIGLETLSLSLYVLCCYMRKWDNAAEGALKYFLLGAISAGFLLYGTALIYGAVGTTQFSGLMKDTHGVLFLSGIAFVTLGLAFKAALVPFHAWAPDVYESSPTPITAFMSVATKAGAFAAFIRIFMVALPHFDPRWYQTMTLLAILSMVYANFVAMKQFQLRRFFAYSGISHAGFLLIPIIAGTSDSLNALLFYLVVYAIATLGSFAILSYLDETKEGVNLNDLKGLFRRSPFLAVTFALCLLTLAGIPPTAGFFAKFFVFKVAFEAQLFVLLFVGLFTAVLAGYYYLRIITLMFSEYPAHETPPTRTPALICLTVLVFFTITALTIYPSVLMPVQKSTTEPTKNTER